MENMKRGEIEVLDCTIRDGGYVNNWDFPVRMAKDVFRQLSKAGVDVVEIGFRDADKNSPLWRRCTEELLQEVRGSSQGAKLGVMVDYGKAGEDQFTEASDSPIDLIRVAVHRDKVKGALKLIERLKAKGYLTSIQLMGYPQYPDEDRREVFRMLSDTQPDYAYVADSYGSLFPERVKSLVEPLLDLGASKVGFHPHNNLQLAFANTLEAIKTGVHIVDATLYGMGRGAGNLATETLLAYLQQKDRNKYNLIYALLCVDIYMLPLRKEYEWGYQLPYMLSGFCECHPYYSKTMIETRRYTVDDVWRALNIVKRRKPIGFDHGFLQQILDSGMFEYDTPLTVGETEDSDETANKAYPVGPPAYMKRHQGRTFLVLANGPSLKEYQREIEAFIKKYDPVTLGANYLSGMFCPQYHSFTNKRRFIKYVQEVDPSSRLLLNCYFSDTFVREYTDRVYEPILFYKGSRNELDIEDGIISNDCSSVSMLLIAVAVVMGAKEVFVAGMDGYVQTDEKGGFYFYEESDDTDSQEFNIVRQRWGRQTLALLDDYLVKSGLSGVNIITPTSYERYYRGIKNFI